MTRPLLICFDGSDEAAEAIRRVGALMPGREALVLSVAIPAKDELPLDPVSDLVGHYSGLYREWDEAVLELARQQSRRGCQLATDAQLHAEPVTAVGKAAATILRIAEEHDVALIVLGAGRHTALGGLLGSVATRVVHHAKRPVLVVPAGQAQT
jgi:nucleotide-binding universal stress UspA family protein